MKGNPFEVMSVREQESFLKGSCRDEMVERVVNPPGDQLMEKGQLRLKRQDFLRLKLQVLWLENLVHEPLQTGIKAIDALVPVGRGQRELIIGDKTDRENLL